MGVTGREGPGSEILARLAADPIAEHSAGGNDNEEGGGNARDEELRDAMDEEPTCMTDPL
jgi:hypothetical protein